MSKKLQLQEKKAELKTKKKASKNDVAKVAFIKHVKSSTEQYFKDDNVCLLIVSLSNVEKGEEVDFNLVFSSMPESALIDSSSLEEILELMGFSYVECNESHSFSPNVWMRALSFWVTYNEIAPDDEPITEEDDEDPPIIGISYDEIASRLDKLESEVKEVKRTIASWIE